MCSMPFSTFLSIPSLFHTSIASNALPSTTFSASSFKICWISGGSRLQLFLLMARETCGRIEMGPTRYFDTSYQRRPNPGFVPVIPASSVPRSRAV